MVCVTYALNIVYIYICVCMCCLWGTPHILLPTTILTSISLGDHHPQWIGNSQLRTPFVATLCLTLSVHVPCNTSMFLKEPPIKSLNY